MKKILLLGLLLTISILTFCQISLTPIGIPSEKLDRLAIFTDESPSFSSFSDLDKYIEDNFNYPPELVKEIIAPQYGRVSFTVNKSGEISNVKTIEIKKNQTDPKLQKEFERVISNMPRWNPTIYKGEEIELNYKLMCQLPFAGAKNTLKDFDTYKGPEFKGGITALNEFISNTLQYPKEAYEKGIEGTVSVQFIVKNDGTIDDIKIKKGVDPLLDEEAIRMVKLMPKWEPNEDNEKKNVYYTLPVSFHIQ